MEWKLINKRTQQDKVGNLLQFDGGVVPKKCQSCKSDLESKITLKQMKQTIPYFKCNDCKFETADGGQALWHEHEESAHTIEFTTGEKVLEINKVIENPPKIIKEADDVIILCSECYDKKY